MFRPNTGSVAVAAILIFPFLTDRMLLVGHCNLELDASKVQRIYFNEGDQGNKRVDYELQCVIHYNVFQNAITVCSSVRGLMNGLDMHFG